MPRLSALTLTFFTATAALAEIPGGHLYLGGGLYWSIPSDKNNRQDFAASGEVVYEFPYAFVAAGADFGGFGRGGLSWAAVSGRAGLTLPMAFAPYAAVGAGYLFENLETDADCYDGPGTCISVSGSGAAIFLEAGLLLFRQAKVGRVALTARLILPQFHLPGPETGAYPASTLTLLGGRLFF